MSPSSPQPPTLPRPYALAACRRPWPQPERTQRYPQLQRAERMSRAAPLSVPQEGGSHMNRRTVLTLMAGCGGSLALALGWGSPASAHSNGGQRLAAPITGQLLTETGAITGHVVGTVTIDHCFMQQGELVAPGNLAGKVLDEGGQVHQSLGMRVRLPMAVTQATCDVVEVTLGPLHLEYAGRRLHLNPVIVPITAEPGGGIVSQWLCDLASETSLAHARDGLNRLLNLFGSP